MSLELVNVTTLESDVVLVNPLRRKMKTFQHSQPMQVWKHKIVRVYRRPSKYDGDWGDTWVSQMDEAIGKVGAISKIFPSSPKKVRVEFKAVGLNWNYPVCCLEDV
jgi:hypothetical protein